MAKTLTLLLQLISAITTYAGFVFFLGSLNPIAPLFMAITVQGGCYYLLNYTSSQKRTGTWKRYILLFFLILTSTITSYIGIFDGVVRPVEKMEMQYMNYKDKVDAIIDAKTQTEDVIEIEPHHIDEAMNLIVAIKDDATEKKISLEYYVNNLDPTKYVQYSWTDNYGNIQTSFSSVTDNDVENEKASTGQTINNLESHLEKINEYLQTNPNSNIIYESYQNIIKDSSKINITDDPDKKHIDDMRMALSKCFDICEEISSNKKDDVKKYYDLLEIDTVISDAENIAAFNALRLPSFDEAAYGKNSDTNNTLEGKASSDSDMQDAAISAENSFLARILNSSYAIVDNLNNIVVSKDATKAQEIRDAINKYITDNYSKLSSLLGSDEYAKTLQQAKDEATIENPQIMPFISPFNDKTVRGEAIFAFVIAFIIDFFSLLIAFALVNKQKSILYFKKVGDLRANREEMLEDCLMYICLNSLQQKQQNGDVTMSRAEIQNFVVQKINTVMRNFLTHIHQIYLSDELNAFGYITEDDIKNFTEDEKKLFFTLNNAAQIYPCHNFEIIKIINADFNEYSDNGTESGANNELIQKYDNTFEKKNVYYLVSKNLHVWFCENFSELLQSTLLFTISDDELWSTPADLSDNNHAVK